MITPGVKRDAAHFHRNVAPIRAALDRLLVDRAGEALEIGSGTGQHVAALAPAFPHLHWRPSDIDADNRASIAAWAGECGAPNIAAPVFLDAAASDWGLAPGALPARLDVIVCFNVVHIAPWAVAEGLFAGAGARLAPEGLLILYGPFKHAGAHVSQSNEDFDAWLRARDPAWGVRDVADLSSLASSAGLSLAEVVEMPANNHILAFTVFDG